MARSEACSFYAWILTLFMTRCKEFGHYSGFSCYVREPHVPTDPVYRVWLVFSFWGLDCSYWYLGWGYIVSGLVEWDIMVMYLRIYSCWTRYIVGVGRYIFWSCIIYSVLLKYLNMFSVLQVNRFMLILAAVSSGSLAGWPCYVQTTGNKLYWLSWNYGNQSSV